MNYVYERDYAVLVRLKVPADARGTVPIRADARWLACTHKICVPEQGQLSLDLPVGRGTPKRAQFDQWREALPRPLAAVGHFALENGKLRVAIPLPANVTVHEPYLFPVTDDVVDYEAKQAFFRSGDMLVAELQPKGAAPRQFEGVIAYDDGRGLDFRATPGPVPEGGTRLGALGSAAVLWAVLGAMAPGTRDLMRAVGWMATALLAYQAGEYVTTKRACAALYREHIGDEWADLLDDLAVWVRGAWEYRIPAAPDERARLRAICARTLTFENAFLTRYRGYALAELRGDDPEGRQSALEAQRRVPLADAEIMRAATEAERRY